MSREENIKRKLKKKRSKRTRVLSLALAVMAVFIIKGCATDISQKNTVKAKPEDKAAQKISKEEEAFTREKRLKEDHLAQVEAMKKAIAKDSNHINAASKYAYDTKEVRDMMLGNTESDGKKVAFLTFDDGPNNKVTPQVLDILDKENVPATFFVVGYRVTENVSDVVKRIINDGHGIALHSFSHDYKKLYPGRSGNSETILKEMNQTNDVLKNILGKDFNSHVVRFPGGHMSWKNMDGPVETLKNAGMEWVDWNSLVGDGERKSVRPTSVSGQVNYIKSTLEQNTNKDKAVVLMHDAGNKQLTADALPQVIQYLRDSGYSFGILK
ncbi:MAG: polysaccharide deacetylase family protein [Gallicola sp.]|nr:polysaccharide deacetylase family protein [Gallicola sp.]